MLGSLKTTKDGVDIRMLKVTAKEPPKNLLKVGDKWLLVIDKVTIYITKCENRWPLPFESPKEIPTQNDTSTRKCVADHETGKIVPVQVTDLEK